MAYDFDLFVIGGGSGGIATSRRAASHGAKVAVAENDRLGGTCVNRGCVPKKLMVYASHFPKYVSESHGYGWKTENGEFSWEEMITAVNNEVKRLNAIYQRMVDNAEVKVYPHHAKLLDHSGGNFRTFNGYPSLSFGAAYAREKRCERIRIRSLCQLTRSVSQHRSLKE